MVDENYDDVPQQLVKAIDRLRQRKGNPGTRKIADAVAAEYEWRLKKQLPYAVRLSHNTVSKILRNPHQNQLNSMLAIVALWTDDLEPFRQLWFDARSGPQASDAPSAPQPAVPQPRAPQRRRLAEEMFLIAYSSEGAVRIPSPALELCLASAVLVDLVESGSVRVSDQVSVDPKASFDDAAHLAVARRIRDFGSVVAKADLWRILWSFREEALRQVSHVLAEDGVIRVESTPGAFMRRARVAYKILEVQVWNEPGLSLSRLVNGRGQDRQTLLLAGLIDMSEAYSCIPVDLPVRQTRARIRELSAAIPPELWTVLHAVRDALDQRSIAAMQTMD
jgi:hypothetical protein